MNPKKLSIAIAWILISPFLFEVSLWAAEIKLKDKSIIKGEIQQEEIKIKTKYGEMDIAVKDFISIIGELIKLKDGTTLKGNFAEKTLSIKTDYGKLKLETKDIDFITFAKEEPPVEPLPPSEEKIPIPEFHGVYLVSDGQLVELKQQFSVPFLGCLKTLSGIDVSDSDAYFVFYREYPPTVYDKLMLVRLYHGVVPEIDPSLLAWWPKEEVTLKTAPLQGKRGAYKLVPAASLSPGPYSLITGSGLLRLEMFDFTVNYQKYEDPFFRRLPSWRAEGEPHADQKEEAASNVALGKPVAVTTNGAEDSLTVGFSHAYTGESPSDITDGSLDCLPVCNRIEDGCVGWVNQDYNELMAITITIDLRETYNISKIRYNPGNCQRTKASNADMMESPFGTTPTSSGWTEQTGNITASKVTIKLEKTRRSWATNWLFIGEIEVWGTAVGEKKVEAEKPNKVQQQIRITEVTVPPIEEGVPTGIVVEKGEHVVINAAGEVDIGRGPVGPNGESGYGDYTMDSPYKFNVGGLEMWIGRKSNRYFVGSHFSKRVQHSGEITLRVIESLYGYHDRNNSGAFKVRIEVH